MANHREAKAEQFEHDLIHRAIADASFRQQLLANPTGVVAAELARVRGRLAPGAVVRVVEDTPTSITIVLPPRGNRPAGFDPYSIGRG